MMGEKLVEEELGKLKLAMAGGVAGAIGAFVLNPFEVMKVQMQVMNSAAHAGPTSAGGGATATTTTRRYRGTMDCFLQTVRNEGIIKGLYRGQTSLLLREIPGNFW